MKKIILVFLLSFGFLSGFSQSGATITLQPVPQTVCEGSTVTLFITATGPGTISYWWQLLDPIKGVFNDIPRGTTGYSGILTNTLSFSTVGNFGAGTYRCRTRIDFDVFSSSAQVNINPSPMAPDASGGTGCTNATVVLNAFGATNGQYRWYTLPGRSYVGIAGATNGTYTTPSLAATTTYYVSINDGTCESEKIAVTATIVAPPPAPTAQGSSGCQSSYTLTASGAAVGNNQQYRWYTVASGGTPIPNETTSSYLTPVLTATTTYYVAISNGACESSRTSVVATVNVPGSPIAPNVSACTNSTATLTASGGTAGQYRWYLVATGGVPISGQTSNIFTTPTLTASTIYYVAINNGLCESGRQAISVNVSTPPAVSSVTDASGCLPFASVTLSATGGSNGQYRWYTVASGGTAIVGEVNSVYTTPSLSATTSYYVSINNGICESARATVTASIVPVPNIPAATGAIGCPNTSFTLKATGASNGQYRWYTTASGGNAITGEVNSSFTTPSLAISTNYYVSVSNGICESSRTLVTATVDNTGCTPPTIATRPLATPVGGIITLDLIPLISTPNSSLDINSIQITIPPLSGAVALINKGELTLNYKGITFTGTEQLTIKACNINGSCASQLFEIDVAGDIVVYNALSPNGVNPKFTIEFIDLIPEAKSNTVTIFDRWQNEVWRGENYNNSTVVFKGTANGGSDLPTGTYFYKIEFGSGKKMKTGFISLKR